MADETQRTILKYEVDRRSVNDATKQLDLLERRTNDLAKAQDAVGNAGKRSANDLRRALGQDEEAIKAATSAQKELNKTIAAQPDHKATQARSEAFGKTSTGLGSIAAVASAVPGLGAGTEGLRIAGDLAGAAEQLPRLAEGAKGIAASIPLVSTAATALTPILGATGASVGALALAAAPIAAIALGIAAALGELNRISEEARKEVQANVEATKARIATEREISTLLKAGDAASAQARLDDLKAQQEDANKLLTELYVARDANQKAYEALGASLNIPERQRLAAEAAELDKQIADAYNQGFKARANEQTSLEAALPAITEAAKVREQETAALEAEKVARQQVLDQQKANTAALNNYAQLAVQANKVIQEYNQTFADTNDARRLRDNREEEDYQESQSKKLAAHNDKLADIEASGQARILDIHNELNSLPAELATEQLKATQKTNDETAKLNADFMKSELNAVTKFHEQERKAEAANKKARLRAIEDLRDSLLAAETANDVLAFIQAKQAGEKQLQRQAEDADDATQERTAAFLTERQQAQEQYAQRAADLQTALTVETEGIRQEYDKRRADLAIALQKEADALKAAKDKENADFAKQAQEEETARAKRLQRQREDDKIADDLRRRALDATLQEIEIKKNAELNAIRAVANAAAAIRVGSSSNALLSGRSGGSSSFRGSSGGGAFLTPFANEGIAFKPTAALLAENEPEGVFRLSTLARMFRGGASGGSQVMTIAPNITIDNLNVGTLTTPEEARGIATDIGKQVSDEIFQMIAAANMGARFNS